MTTPTIKNRNENEIKDELLPCPFCGGHARPMKCKVGIEGTMGCNKWVTITCSMCEINNGGKGGFMRPRYDTEEEAAKAWNTRAEPQNVEGDVKEALDAICNGLSSLSIEERDCYQSGFSSEGLRLANIGSQIGAALQTIRSNLTAQDVNAEIDLDNAREIFENWLTGNGNYPHMKHKSFGGVYLHEEAAIKWDGFKAGYYARAEQKGGV